MKLRFRSRGNNKRNTSITTAFIDVVLNNYLSIVVLLVALLIVASIKKEEEAKGAVKSIITIHATWPEKWTQDIDMWAQGPDDRSVGYSRPQSPTFVLLRDDTGWDATTDRNEEFIVSVADKDKIAGHYIVNLFYFRGVGEVPVEIKIMIQRFRNGVAIDMQTVFDKKIILEKSGAEKTAVQFDMDVNGEFIKESVRFDFERIAAAKGAM